MSRLSEYANKFETIKLERRDGILQMTLHSAGGSLQWGPTVQSELVEAFTQIGADRENRIIILTGTGPDFSGLRAEPGKSFYRELSAPITADLLDRTHWTAKRVMTRMLDIEVPMIAAVNGPAMRHSEIALMCDIVFAADTAKIGDPHVSVGLVAGDGGAVIWPQRIGFGRAKEYLFTGDLLTAQKAEDIGLINHSVPADELDAAVDAFCQRLLNGATDAIRWSKVVVNLELKRIAHALMDPGIAYESLSVRTADHREAVDALIEKRKPDFTRR